MRTVEIPLKLPSFNEYVNVCRTNKYMAAKMKRDLEQEIGYFILDLPKYDKPIQIHFHWIEGNQKRDYDNICYAKKFILDALVKYQKLKDDNRNYVYSFRDTFEYKKGTTKVVLEIEEWEKEKN